MSEFKKFRKIKRFFEEDVIVTEKIDGTNGLIFVSEDLEEVKAGSRNRWISPEDDHHSFARWVEENKEELKRLGPGYHYGEWWGEGVQRGYGMKQKVFSLFNVSRWSDDTVRPICCDVVPVLWSGNSTDFFNTFWAKPDALFKISKAALKYDVEFDKPEGYTVYLVKTGVYLKVPMDK